MPLIASFMAVTCASATAYGVWHETAEPTRPGTVAAATNDASVLLEAPECAAEPAAPPASSDTATSADGSGGSVAVQRLVVVVPPTVIVRVDDAGRLVSVSTNTGCAPRAADAWWVMQPDGTAARTAATVFERQRWVGDFTQTGVAQTQP